MTAQQAPLGEKTMAVLMAMLVALMPFSVDAYLPAIPEMAKSLGSDIHRIEQSPRFFMFGVAFGQGGTAVRFRILKAANLSPWWD